MSPLVWLLALADMSTSHQYFATSYTHWLPVSERIIFKIAVLAFNCIRGAGPAYFNDVCTPLANILDRVGLRAAERSDLLVPSTETKIGGRSFRVAAPTV